MLKVKVRYAGGLEVSKSVGKIPFEGEVFDGEIVDQVMEWDVNKNGHHAYVVLRRPPA